MLTPEQLANRHTYIGSSEIATVLGINPYQTQADLQMLKRFPEAFPVPPEDNEAIELGNRFEPVLIDFAEERLGVKMERNVFIRKAEDSPLACNLDGAYRDELFAAEAKTAGLTNKFYGAVDKGWGEPGTDEIPDVYKAQCHYQMMVSGFVLVYVPALVLGLGIQLYKVERDEDTCKTLEQVALDWWDRHVVRGKPVIDVPMSESVWKRIRRTPDKSVTVSADLIRSVHEATAARKEAEQREEFAKGVLMAAMQDASEAVAEGDSKLKARMSVVKTSRFDTTAFKEAHPDIAKAFEKESSHNRLTVTVPKP